MKEKTESQMRSTIFVILLLLSSFLVVSTDIVSATQDGDYTYTELGAGNATITGYTGPGGAIVIPSTLNGNNIVAIWGKAFYSCTSLISVTIPNGVMSIGGGAFGSCTSLTTVLIPNSVTSIGTGAFRNCTSLPSLTIPDGVIDIHNFAFENCTNLTSIIIGSAVTTIGTGAFQYCRSLTSITFLGLVSPTGPWPGTGQLFNGVPPEIRGHAYVTSNFPLPGDTYYGLTMGANLPTLPSAPADLIVTAGNAQVTVSWTIPMFNGGSPIIEYRVYRSIAENGTYLFIASSVDPTYTDLGLTGGQTYWYKVSAMNINGEGGMCTSTNASVLQPINSTGDLASLSLIAIVAIAVLIIVLLGSLKRKSNK